MGGGKREPGIHCLRMRLISQKSWEIGNYHIISTNFLTDDGSLSVDCSSAPSSSPQRLGTPDVSLKEVQIASSLDVC